MSDFLTRLVGRTFGLAPTVRPRVPSLFDPDPNIAARFPKEEAAIAEPRPPEASSPRPLEERRSGRPVRDEPPAPLDSPRDDPSPSRRSPTPDVRTPPIRRLEMKIETPPTPNPTPPTPGARPTPEVPAPSLPKPADPAPVEVRPPIGEVKAEAVLGRIPESRSTTPPPVDRPEKPAPRPADRPSPVVAVAARPADRREAQPVASPLKTVSPRLPAEPRPRDLRPIIRVSIGRIEVRAVAPPAAPKPESRGPRVAPVASLDDYLRRRGGGGA